MIYIIAQTILVKQEQKGNQTFNYWENIIRKVDAKNRSEAIGKFVTQTSSVIAKEKLAIECIQLDQLRLIS